jgi:hypothetical protein
MVYEDRVVCFIDILGFATLVRNTIMRDGSCDEAKVTALADALEVVRHFLDVDRPQDRPSIEVTQFSDSIVVSFPANTENGVFDALLSILWVQVNLVLKGILCRGAIVRGQLIHTDRLLFGPAMIDAYVLESKAALYPRVILNQEIITTGATAHASHHHPQHEIESIMQIISKDSDGMYYINYITGAQSELDDPELDYPLYLYKLREIIAAGLGSSDPSVAIKYKWLRERFKPHLDEVLMRAHSLPDGDELREMYDSLAPL